jgi:hypothetical protein
MGKVFRPSSRESSIINKIESSKEYERRKRISSVRDNIDELSNAIALKLIENKLVETTNKDSLDRQIYKSLEQLGKADDFEVDYQVSPIRTLVPQPNVVSLYLTAFVIETLIHHKDIIDIYGSDEEIYFTIDRQVKKILQI